MSHQEQITCTACNQTYALQPAHAGTSFPCKCGATVSVPPNAPAPPPLPPVQESVAPTETAHTDLPPSADVPIEMASVDCAYQPSGAMGNIPILLLIAVLGIVGGVVVGLLVGGIAALINVIHSMLPVFICIIPLFVILIIVCIPIAATITVGFIIGMGTFSAHCRNTAVAGLISLVASSCSIVLLMQITDMIAPGGLLGSIRLLVGGCFHMQWGANFQPVNVPAWLIYVVIGVSGLIGVFFAWATAYESIASNPYCETCALHKTKQTHWSIATVHLPHMIDALEQAHFTKAFAIPPCANFENRVDVDVWTCECGDEPYLELFGHTVTVTKDGKNKHGPTRLYSMILPPDALRLLTQDNNTYNA